MLHTQLAVALAAVGFALPSSASILGSSVRPLPIWGYTNSTDRAALTQLLEVDYSHIIVGGGTAGLALAVRLSEDPSTLVLVIEAGEHAPGNPGVQIPAMAGSTFKSSIDWDFHTVPQEHANQREVYIPRGKALGGSSVMNFMAWTRPSAALVEFGEWVNLAKSSAWSWTELLSYFKKSETFHEPGPNNLNTKQLYDTSAHGHDGPVAASYGPYMSTQFSAFFASLLSFGIAKAKDLTDGGVGGVSWSASSIDPKTKQRVTSETAYLLPVAESRTNLVVLTSAHATKIIWETQHPPIPDQVRTATGVEFVVATTGQTFSARSSGEVVLSAGSLQTPQLLELSGVGSPAVLSSFGIDTVVDLPGVGANLQDHPAVVNVYKLKEGVQSLDHMVGASLAEAVAEYAKGGGILTQALSLLAFAPSSSWLTQNDHQTVTRLIADSYPFLPEGQRAAQVKMWEADAPMVEFIPVNVYFGETGGEPNASYISLATCLQHSYSRGSVHIASAHPLAKPAIDPAFLAHPADGFLLMRGAQLMRKAAFSSDMHDFVEAEAEPGLATESDEAFAEWVKSSIRHEYHPIGTASMLPREDGGVVDPDLRVYGTSNVRVVDLSVMPIHLSTHPQTVAYAVAEKAAEIILKAGAGPASVVDKLLFQNQQPV